MNYSQYKHTRLRCFVKCGRKLHKSKKAQKNKIAISFQNYSIINAEVEYFILIFSEKHLFRCYLLLAGWISKLPWGLWESQTDDSQLRDGK